ncbi:hypothetical protein D3C83_90860 [compost metagenome]
MLPAGVLDGSVQRTVRHVQVAVRPTLYAFLKAIGCLIADAGRRAQRYRSLKRVVDRVARVRVVLDAAELRIVHDKVLRE